MKKSILSKIIMWVLMVGIFLLPISPSLEIKNNKITLDAKTNKTKAETQFEKDFKAIISVNNITSESARIQINLQQLRSNAFLDYINEEESSLGGAGNSDNPSSFRFETSNSKNFSDSDSENPTWKELGYGYETLTFGTKYTPPSGSVVILKKIRSFLSPETTYYYRFSAKNKDGDYVDISNRDSSNPASFTTLKTGEGTTPEKGTELTSVLDLNCGISNIGGCIAGVLFVVFEVVSWIASFAGQFLDFLIYYSTNSTSYQSEFVSKGWGAVRDIANIFFIIALLYIAIKMILSIDDHHGKKMITTIIMVALIINFSMFITQVVIDGSNILAKVFYNNIDSKYENKDAALGAEGEKSISVGLVDKFNPEKLMTQDVYDANGGTTMFIIILLLLIAVLVYVTYIFFSVGLLFVSRVVMLWFSMIFAPIAFASHALPFEIPGLGHRDWWTNLFKNAFLAPLFIFMLYMVVMFAGFLNEIIKYTDGATKYQKIMSVIIPFVILAVILMKAKEMAVKYAGEMGAAVVKGAAVLGGVALGGAALGGATLGRNTVRALMRKASQDESSNNYKEYKDGNISRNQLNFKDKTLGWLGYKLNKDQEEVGDSKHARHTLDEKSKAKYGENYKGLSGPERQWIKDRIDLDILTRNKQVATYIDPATGATKNIIYGNRKTFAELSDAEQTGLKSYLKAMTGAQRRGIEHGSSHLEHEAKKKIGIMSSLMQSSRTGTFDARNLSKVTAEEFDNTLNKFASGLTSILGSSMRSSIKGAFGSQYGTGQGKFFKDLGHTISEAMKGAQIHVDLSHVGEEKKEGHGGGHGGHH